MAAGVLGLAGLGRRTRGGGSGGGGTGPGVCLGGFDNISGIFDNL